MRSPADPGLADAVGEVVPDAAEETLRRCQASGTSTHLAVVGAHRTLCGRPVTGWTLPAVPAGGTVRRCRRCDRLAGGRPVSDLPAWQRTGGMDAAAAVVPRIAAPVPAATTPAAAAMADLLDEADVYAERARAANTRRAYTTDWEDFTTWCIKRRLRPLPAEAATVRAYITYLANRRQLKNATIQRRMAAISQAHKLSGYDSPTTDGQVREVWKGMRNTAERQTVREAPPADSGVVRQLVATLDPPAGEPPVVTKRLRLARLRDRAILLLGLAGAFRESELAALDVDDVDDGRRGLTVLVRRSKTDPAGKGHYKAIPYGADPATCPVSAWQAWRAASGITEGAAFRGIDRHGRLGATRAGRHGRTDRLSATVVNRIVQRCAAAAGVKLELTSHSLRAGFVTEAVEQGVADQKIMEQTGHKTRKMLDKYRRPVDIWVHPAAAKLGL